MRLNLTAIQSAACIAISAGAVTFGAIGVAAAQDSGTIVATTNKPRMAPTQNTTGTGAMSGANSSDSTSGQRETRGHGDSRADANQGASKKRSTKPRMAPTQNTKGTGTMPDTHSSNPDS